MTTSLLLALAAFALVSSITPGPNNLMLLASGINFGFRRTLPHMAGVALGFTVMVAIVGAATASVTALVPGLLGIVKWVSVAYLLYLAWKIATAPLPDAQGRGRARPMTFLAAAAFQWVNPKAWTMALTAATAYLPAHDRSAAVVAMALVFGAVNLPSVGLWAVLGTSLRRFLADPVRLRWFNVAAALTLVATLYPVLASAR
ncbi:MAG: LysE family translocator [Sphingomonadaceae bacterium]|nr:LysE family translocator [Sphingomonadaceae bacterium]